MAFSTRNDHASKRSNSMERETIVTKAKCTDVMRNELLDEEQNSLPDTSHVSHEDPCQLQNVHFQNRRRTIQNSNETAEGQPDKNQDVWHECVENQISCVRNEDECDESHEYRTENHNKRTGNRNFRLQSGNKFAKNGKKFSTGYNSYVPTDSKNREFSLQTVSSNKQKSSLVVKAAQEKIFLNTIIIVGCVAVVTVIPSVITSEVLRTVAETNHSTNRIVFAVLWPIFALNFAANPFIYCLRLKRYRKTFNLIYSCKNVSAS